MTDVARRVVAMTEGRRADTGRRRRRVLDALAEAAAAGEDVNTTAIARRAGVDRSFLYRHRDLLDQLRVQQSQSPGGTGTAAAPSKASLQSDLLAAQQRAIRLAARVQQLERRLSEVMGEQAWRESGLGAPDDIDQLHRRIASLEAEVADLRVQLNDRSDELAAARLANRELMTRLNA